MSQEAPIVLVEAGLALKTSEREALKSSQLNLLPLPRPIRQLRVLSAVANAPARAAALQIPRNMRVPLSSIIARVRRGENFDFAGVAEDSENLTDWTSSDGGSLPDVDVTVQARRIIENVLALIAPVNVHRN